LLCRPLAMSTPTRFSSGATAVQSDPGASSALVPSGNEDKIPDDRGSMTPTEMVAYLDRYIIGQHEAKKAVANALRMRWRRQQLSPELREDIMPKNILMVGPTGCGKTEIARRLSKLVDAPFIKVEATKFTEVGFHGRDVDQIIRDLVEMAIKRQRSKLEEELTPKAEKAVEQTILDALMGNLTMESEKNTWLNHLRNGLLDDRMITVEIPFSEGEAAGTGEFGREQGAKAIKMSVLGDRRSEKRKLPIKDARTKLLQVALDKMINQDMITTKSIEAVEQEGIVFIDEIDKLCNKNGSFHGADASAEGVQRDLLPIIEGCDVSTRYGNVKTDHILFICSGAFHSVKPRDLLAELQGRLPVRVSLHPLTIHDFVRILQEPKHNLIFQNKEMMKTEDIDLRFDEDAVKEIAKVSWDINSHVENIGARRLHTVLEKVMEEISYEAPDRNGETVEITSDSVRNSLGDMLKKNDLSKFIL